MAINTFSTLKTAIGNWLNRTDIDDRIDEFITIAEDKIYRSLRVRQMETALSDTISSGVIAVPSGYLEMKYMYLNTTPTTKLVRTSLENIYHNYPTRSSTGVPAYFAREGTNFIFGPYPDSGYTAQGIYYKKLTALGTSNETNWITTDIPELLLYGALCEAEPFIWNDPRLPMWQSKYEQELKRIQEQDDDEDFSGSAPQMMRG